jgi:hypothetical protein
MFCCMPLQVFTKLLLTSLPHELGKFIIDSSAAAASSSSSSSCKPGPAGVWLAGEVSLAGPPTACLSANLTRTSADVPRGKADIRDFVKVGFIHHVYRTVNLRGGFTRC